MSQANEDAGTIQVLLERLNKFRLPRALELKERMDGGGTLDQNDIEFLERVFHDAHTAQGLVDRHPELQALAGKLSALYSEITAKALENEKNQGGKK